MDVRSVVGVTKVSQADRLPSAIEGEGFALPLAGEGAGYGR